MAKDKTIVDFVDWNADPETRQKQLGEWTEYWSKTPDGVAWREKKEAEDAEKVRRWHAITDKDSLMRYAVEFPPGYDKGNPPPSGFVDEPEIYEDVRYSPERVAEEAKKKSVEKEKWAKQDVERQPTADNQLLDNGDAMFWAETFVRIRKEQLAERGVDIAARTDVMVGWFANAFQRGEWNSAFYKEWIDNYFKENKLGEYADA